MKDKRTNYEITSSKVYLITQEWENLGLINTEKAISMAEETLMDLVQIGEKEWIPLTKIMDYWKFVFKQQKNVAKNKANSKQGTLKTVRITYKIWDHDLSIRREQVTKFWKEGHLVKVVLMLRWRENQYVDMAVEKLKSFAESLTDTFTGDMKISKTWTTFSVILNPKK